MKRRIQENVPNTETTKCDESEDEVMASCKDVVNKLLDYCDRLEETKNIIREDDYPVRLPDMEAKPNSPVVSKVFKEKQKSLEAFRRTAIEIKRLNCKLLSISTDDELNSTDVCKKEHCARGCVCNSLDGNYSNLLQVHCGRYGCMFECTCKTVEVSESNPFSQGIINRLQDEATKNLAKVEKEFTQTLIKTNNQLILVGESNERRKRKLKIPKKFDDYVENDLFEKSRIEYEPPKLPEKSVVQYEDMIIPSCYVKLHRYNLDDIIPYCMIHSLYKCYCRKEQQINLPAEKSNATSKPDVNSRPLLVKLKQPNRKKFLGHPSWDKHEHTCRSRGLLGSLYLLRNKQPIHSERIQKSTNKLEKQLKKYLTENSLEIMDEGGSFGIKSTTAKQNMEGTEPKDVSSKPTVNLGSTRIRKQRLELIPDFGDKNDLVVQRIVNNMEINIEIKSQKSVPEVEEINTEKELKLQRRHLKQTEKQTKILKKSENGVEALGKESEKEYLAFLAKYSSQIQIVPWSQLITKYESGFFQLWCLNYSDTSLVTVTESRKRPSLLHYNIKFFEAKDSVDPPCDIVKCIVNKETPLGKPKDQISFLMLQTNKDVWKICGLCEQNNSNESNGISVSIVQFYSNVDNIITESEHMYSEPLIKNNAVTSVDQQQEILETPPLNSNTTNDTNKLVLCKKKFESKVLKLDTIYQNDQSNEQHILACIPKIATTCRWRVVPINKRFDHISFLRCDFTLEYDAIINALTISRKHSITTMIRSPLLHKNYPHRKFGIYCDYRAPDKIFIGPYFTNENHDLKFMFFLKKVLVDVKTGFWYRQSTFSNDDDDVELLQQPNTLIDLTYETDEEEPIIENSSTQSPDTNELHSQNLTIDSNFSQETISVDKFDNSNSKSVPRYIVTNIPDVGYIEAYLHNNGLDVILCPLSRTPRRFTHWSTAITSLHRIMTARFIFVPSSFKLEVTMVDTLDITKHKPLNKTILNGCYVAGEFGVQHIANITREDLFKFGLSQYEILGLLQIRERKLLQLIVMHLSKLLKVEVPIEAPSFNILMGLADKTVLEVELLKQQAISHMQEKERLEQLRSTLVDKYLGLIKTIPNKYRLCEMEKLNEILNSKPKRNVNENSLLINRETITVEDDFRDIKKGSNLEREGDNDYIVDNNIKASIRSPSREPQDSAVSITEMLMQSNQSVLQKKKKVASPNSMQAHSLNKPRNLIRKDDYSAKIALPSQTNINIQKLSVLKQKQQKKNDQSLSKPILNTVPVLTKIVIPGTSTLINSIPSQNIKTNSVSAIPPVPLSAVKIGKSTYLSHRDIQKLQKQDSRATLTSLPKSEGSGLNQNYIALKDGDKMKYFQIIPNRKDTKSVPVTSTLQVSSLLKTSPKKI